MSATNPSSMAPGLRRLPFTVRLSPQFLNRLLSSRQSPGVSQGTIHGLLFGITDENLLVVQAFRSFAGAEERSMGERESFGKLLAAACKDPEISPLELIGWYAVRTNGGLLQSDLEFHNLRFQRPNDLALVLKPEGDTGILLELYCRSADGVLSSEGHRWGAVRQALGSTLVGPVEVTMRSRMQDDFFLRAYQVDREEEDGSPGWKNTLQLTTQKAFGWLAVSRNEKAPQARPPLNESPVPLEPVLPGQTATGVQRQLRPRFKENHQTLSPAAARKQLVSSLAAQRETGNTASLQSIRAGAPPPVPAIVPERPRKRGMPWLSSLLVFAAAAGLTFGLVYSRGSSSADGTPGFLKSFFPAPGLGLRLENQGDRLLLSWNRHHPAVRNTKGGILQIDDGPQHRQVVLDAAQVSNGSVLYRPISDDVTFRLEVEGIRGGKVSESMRVLEASKPGSALDLSAPAAVPPAEPNSRSQSQPNNGYKTAAPLSSAPTPTSTAAVAPKMNGPAANGSGTNPSPAARPVAPAGEMRPPALPLPAPFDVPLKQNTEDQGQVHFDVVPPAPAQTINSKGGSPTAHPAETARNTPPEESHTPPATVIEKQKPEGQNPLPLPSSAPLNIAIPNPTPSRSIPGSYRAPRPLRQALPNTNMLLPNVLAAAGRVEVLVKVNETGHVTEAHVVNGAKKISPTLAGVSIHAAKQWIFEPATIDGRPVASEHSIVFQFQAPK